MGREGGWWGKALAAGYEGEGDDVYRGSWMMNVEGRRKGWCCSETAVVGNGVRAWRGIMGAGPRKRGRSSLEPAER